MTVADVARDLQSEMNALSLGELILFASDMGVNSSDMARAEIEDACIALEQYTYTH
jgi:hypothetical protein